MPHKGTVEVVDKSARAEARYCLHSAMDSEVGGGGVKILAYFFRDSQGSHADLFSHTSLLLTFPNKKNVQ